MDVDMVKEGRKGMERYFFTGKNCVIFKAKTCCNNENYSINKKCSCNHATNELHNYF